MQDTEAPEDAANRAEAGNTPPYLCALCSLGLKGKPYLELQSRVDLAAWYLTLTPMVNDEPNDPPVTGKS